MEVSLDWYLGGPLVSPSLFGYAVEGIGYCETSNRVHLAASSSFSENEQIKSFVHKHPLFKYVPEKGCVVRRLITTNKKSATPGKILRLVRLLNKGPMTIKAPIFTDEDFADLVVLSRIAKKITSLQLATAFYWKSVLESYKDQEIVEVPLFEKNGSVNFKARRIITETVKLSKNRVLLSSDEINHWFQMMRREAPSEKVFCCTKVGDEGEIVSRLDIAKGSFNERAGIILQTLDPSFRKEGAPTVVDSIIVHGKQRFFNQINYEGESCRMFASVTMAKQIYQFVGGQIKMVPRFGLSDLRENGLNNERDIALQSPYAELPEEADSFWAPGEQFTTHDLVYHALLVSAIPKEHQRLFIAVADEVRKENPPLAAQIEDMEYSFYLLVTRGNPVEGFMRSLKFAVDNTMRLLNVEIYKKIIQKGQNRDERFAGVLKHLKETFMSEQRALRAVQEQESYALVTEALKKVLKGKKTPFQVALLKRVEKHNSIIWA